MAKQGFCDNVVCQIAVIVRDIEKASQTYADVFGLPEPKAIITDPVEKAHTVYRGQPSAGRAKLAFFQLGPQVALELIEPIGGPSTWQEFLDAHGEGVHHIAFRVKGMDAALAYLDGKGIPTVQRGDYTGGRYAYCDSAPKLHVLLELLESLPK